MNNMQRLNHEENLFLMVPFGTAYVARQLGTTKNNFRYCTGRNKYPPLPWATVLNDGTSQENRNLYYQFIIDERKDYLVFTDSYLVHLLDGTAERALPTPGDQLRFNEYFITNGDRTLINTSENGRFSQTSTFPLASNYENQLILAEAKFKTNDETGALSHFNNVRASLRDEYNSDEGGFPNSSAIRSMLLKQIIEEKYITLVGEIVTFHDLRITQNCLGLPNKTTGSTGASEFPQRFLYPQTEVDTNSNIPTPLPEFFATTETLGGSYKFCLIHKPQNPP